MRTLKFRNVDVTPDDPVERWGVEGLLAAIDRGSLPHWRRIVTACRADPWGPVAAQTEQALALAEDVGAAATLRRALATAREGGARAEVQRRLRTLVEVSGLTAAEFAQRLGTSGPRMSTYLSGKVVPSAALLVRSEMVSQSARASTGVSPRDFGDTLP